MSRFANPTVEELEENKKIYRDNGLVYYTPLEELLNALTHGIGVLFGFVGLIFMAVRANTVQGYVTSVVVAIGFLVLYATSTTYHILTDLKIKNVVRRLDHATVNLVVISCGVALCLMTSNSTFNYIAFALCYAIAIINSVLCWVDLSKYKAVTFLSQFAIGGLFLAVYIINFDYIPKISNIFYLIGLINVLLGSAIFGIKKRYVHTIFHIFVLIGPIAFYLASYFLIY